MPASFAILLLAAPPVETRRVKDAVAEVRALPSDKPESYVTNTLRRGASVEVVEAVGAWVKIRPPAGSHSWINARFLKTIPPDRDSRVVSLDDASGIPVFIGREARGERPKVSSCKLKNGHIVVFLSTPERDAEGSWARIESPPGEVRYIRASALEGTASFVRAGETPAPVRTGPVPIARTPSANTEADGETAYRQAYQADMERRWADAAPLYREASRCAVLKRDRPMYSNEAERRAIQIENWLRASGSPAAPATASLHQPTGARASEEPRVPPVGVYKGRLRRAGVRDGRSVYVMDLYVSRGLRQPGFYVVPGYGVNLAWWLDRDVELHGITRGSGMSFHVEATLVKWLR